MLDFSGNTVYNYYILKYETIRVELNSTLCICKKGEAKLGKYRGKSRRTCYTIYRKLRL